MKASRDILAALLVVFAAVTVTPAATGCYVGGGGYVVTEAPPAQRYETIVRRPGYVWVHGHWTRPGRQWVWQPGYYVRERPNAYYVSGYWARRGTGYVWVAGGWRARSSATVRRY